jgi:hypothetical protein
MHPANAIERERLGTPSAARSAFQKQPADERSVRFFIVHSSCQVQKQARDGAADALGLSAKQQSFARRPGVPVMKSGKSGGKRASPRRP